MKFYSLAVLFLVTEGSAIQLNKEFLIGDQKVEFDEEEAFKEDVVVSTESLIQADIKQMEGFDTMLA